MQYAHALVAAGGVGGRGYGRMGDHWGPGLLGLGVMVLVTVGIAALVLTLVRSARHTTTPALPTPPPGWVPGPAPAPAPTDPALAQLRLRYARGEVAPHEFRRMSADLGVPVAEPEPTIVPPTEPSA